MEEVENGVGGRGGRKREGEIIPSKNDKQGSFILFLYTITETSNSN